MELKDRLVEHLLNLNKEKYKVLFSQSYCDIYNKMFNNKKEFDIQESWDTPKR